MATSLTLVLAGAAVAALAGAPLLVRRGSAAAARCSAALAVLGSALGIAGALVALLGGGAVASAAWSVPGGSLSIAIDGLSAWFLLPVFVVSGLAAVYGLGYHAAGHAGAAAIRVFQGLLTAGMATLLVARNSALFLLGWEAMALAAFFLIATEHRRAAARQAAWVYLVATHAGTACLIAAFALLQSTDGSLDWTPSAIAALPQARALWVFALAAIGFGLKAGLMPLHVWLPAAHANAPSHVSAVLSGVMIKMGVYGVLRMLALLPSLPPACGALLLALGAASALLGVAATLGQSDLKRLLAYSSIENIGIVFAGIGLFALGRALGAGEIAVLGLAGALLHVANHALFKPLLFFGAGSVIHATGTRDIDALGGLLRRMPRTGLCFVVGASAVCGLPLLNGFAGEFALFLGLFQAATSASHAIALLAAAALTALALVGGLALVAFVRCTATVFLGHGRSPVVADVHESPRSMTASMGSLAVLCVLLGLAPWLLLPLLRRALAEMPGTAALDDRLPFGALSAVACGCALALAATAWRVRRAWRSPAGARVGTWDCGYVDATSPRLQYTGSSFAQFAVRLLRWTVRERGTTPATLPLFAAPRSFARAAAEPLLDGFLWPLCRRVADRCSQLRFLQRGKLQIYLLYILIVMVVLLSWSALTNWSRP